MRSLGGSIQHITSSLSNWITYIAKRYSAKRLAYFYGKEGWTLWDGEISPQDILISDNQKYRELQHQQSQNKTELLEVLSDEQKELLEKFCATEIELNGISEREAFTAGFKIAMRLAAEAFCTADRNE